MFPRKRSSRDVSYFLESNTAEILKHLLCDGAALQEHVCYGRSIVTKARLTISSGFQKAIRRVVKSHAPDSTRRGEFSFSRNDSINQIRALTGGGAGRRSMSQTITS